MRKITIIIITLLLFLTSCFDYEEAYRRKHGTPTEDYFVPSMNYSIQVGSFKDLDNALFLIEKIRSFNAKPYYFKDNKGNYKVRFGNFLNRKMAEDRARKLVSYGAFNDYYIIAPENYRVEAGGGSDIRANLVNTAKQYIGIPYKWGGTSAKSGFDCSGLTMVTYRINGYNIPRTSRNQFSKGKHVGINDLKPGDLVFFNSRTFGRVSHVGLYIGNRKFIHAPSKGKTIRINSLENSYYKRRFMGGRSYIN